MNDSIKFVSYSAILACFIYVSDVSLSTAYNLYQYSKPVPLELPSIDTTKTPDEQVCKSNPPCKKLAEAVFFEARGEPEVGQYAVAFTIMNRRKSKKFPNSIIGVVNQKINGVCQFSYLCELVNLKYRIKKDPNSWNKSLKVAYDAYYYAVPNFTSGSDHYYNSKKVKRTPFWATKYKFMYAIGDHKFYKSVSNWE